MYFDMVEEGAGKLLVSEVLKLNKNSIFCNFGVYDRDVE